MQSLVIPFMYLISRQSVWLFIFIFIHFSVQAETL
jgi:hypothetical protein